MIRGMHYMCWYREDWNYHPSLPMKRLQQVEDIVDVGGNMLLWSCLGSGAIGLPYLEREAYDEVPPRLRFYGFLNDSEFCEECTKRGIAVYAVVWKAQMWEFPAEYNDDGTELLALNKLRGKGNRGGLGMRELSKGAYPALFKSMADYFPEGIYNSEGGKVEDYLEEFRCRTLDGGPIFSRWLMVPDHDQWCYTPCGNNPAYITYLKREIEMMVDAGAGGILIDEPDAQLVALMSGGCFCKDCIKGFREYLKSHPTPEAEGIDLDSFDYGRFLREKGYRDDNLVAKRASVPLFAQFLEFALDGMEKNMAELAAHVRQYSTATRGKALPVTANMLNGFPHAARLRKHCDTICGEKGGFRLRQDGFYRFGRAFMQGKEGSYIESPDQHILDVVADIENRKNDTYMLLILEPLAHGFNIAIPYGAWLMHMKKDSFYPDMLVEREMGRWLKENDHLFTNGLEAGTALVYDHRNAYEMEMALLRGILTDPTHGGFITFHDLAQALCNEHVLYNVLYVSEDEPLTVARLEGYHTVILPDACRLTDAEADAVLEWAGAKERAVVMGKVHLRLAGLPAAHEDLSQLRDWILEAGQPVIAEDVPQVGISLHRTDRGYALHLVNYGLDEESRRVEPVPSMSFQLSFEAKGALVHTFPKSETEARIEGNVLRLTDIGLYTVVELWL